MERLSSPCHFSTQPFIRKFAGSKACLDPVKMLAAAGPQREWSDYKSLSTAYHRSRLASSRLSRDAKPTRPSPVSSQEYKKGRNWVFWARRARQSQPRVYPPMLAIMYCALSSRQAQSVGGILGSEAIRWVKGEREDGACRPRLSRSSVA